MNTLNPDEAEPPDAELELDRVGRLRKSATAFRTISEVADDLHVPQHVLRFWETRFPQVKPLKRGGGRRYYRPDDVVLLRRISDLLYIQGYTIKGVQRLLREGDGTLEGDLPPPDIADRDGDDTPLLGAPAGTSRHASSAAPSDASAGTRLARPPARMVADAAGTSASPAIDPAGGAEQARMLQQVLREVLDELEALRRQLAV